MAQNLMNDLRSRIESFKADYKAHSPMLLRDGLSLKNYVATCMSEFDMGPMDDALSAELDRAQAQLGTPWDAANWLGSKLGLEA